MKIKSIARKSPKDKSVKYYVSPIKQGILNTDIIAEEIAGRCSLTSGDILNVFRNLKEVLPKYLAEGYHVKLDDIGTFHVTLGSKGSETEDKCTAEAIRSIVIRNTCDRSLRQKVYQIIRFEKQKEKEADGNLAG